MMHFLTLTQRPIGSVHRLPLCGRAFTKTLREGPEMTPVMGLVTCDRCKVLHDFACERGCIQETWVRGLHGPQYGGRGVTLAKGWTWFQETTFGAWHKVQRQKRYELWNRDSVWTAAMAHESVGMLIDEMARARFVADYARRQRMAAKRAPLEELGVQFFTQYTSEESE